MQREVERAYENAMTVRNLLRQIGCGEEELKGLDLDVLETKLFFVSDYGDYHNTQQALPVAEICDADTTAIHPSAYSHSGVAVRRDYEDRETRECEREEDDDVFRIFLLSS